MTDTVWSDRHPSVRHFQPYFRTEHLPEPLAAISRPFGRLADELLGLLTDDTPEVSAALRKLVEAKDCAVRARVAEVHQAAKRAAELAEHGVEHVDLGGQS